MCALNRPDHWEEGDIMLHLAVNHYGTEQKSHGLTSLEGRRLSKCYTVPGDSMRGKGRGGKILATGSDGSPWRMEQRRECGVRTSVLHAGIITPLEHVRVDQCQVDICSSSYWVRESEKAKRKR